MTTSHSIQRLALSAVLLVLPLIIYCSEISGCPQSSVGPTENVESAISAASSPVDGVPNEDGIRSRRVLADMDATHRSGS